VGDTDRTMKTTTRRDELALWRRDRLVRAGFPPGLAAALAREPRVDLHRLIELTERGCPPALAARIMAPDDRP